MIINGLKILNKYNGSTRKSECEYPNDHDQGIDNEIYTYLIRRYEEKGRNFFFRASRLPFPYLSGQRKGAALRRICENHQFVERWNTGQIIVWRTKFNNGFAP
ncbi:MAG: hypothetical protein JSW06_03055 [Thermoplasmatales archaeon]|nr:MAG: hypothetical protein JSW06_03055 [Thermoplasmatales archaeon]